MNVGERKAVRYLSGTSAPGHDGLGAHDPAVTGDPPIVFVGTDVHGDRSEGR